mmetsp:Transcript_6523/g.8847  ORF Transcript_6523/g.8847 Transcript_6523/m.8847 type:complete len:137 (-) Transcript_6523:249-659(-)|eukprot:CAMPEP_0196585028 /NCGR_PEP_ID=MMETSP1081-20130531/49343_1 /TAXON_ID=36882 /ORGANISM="Pyramimonas amylifera, Strain CCMP720" /LENGTH=136 /DNA_ID=CAMNT_0041906437 /DNA_START=70 /DNA_END=480 /DNA_ORIENTATION=-
MSFWKFSLTFTALILIFYVSSAQAAGRPEEYVEDLIKNNPVAIISKTYCPYCHKAKRISWDELGVKPAVIELDMRPTGDGPAIHRHLKNMLGTKNLPSVPQVWVNGHFIGGSDAMRAAMDSGKLKEYLEGNRHTEL